MIANIDTQMITKMPSFVVGFILLCMSKQEIALRSSQTTVDMNHLSSFIGNISRQLWRYTD